MLNKDKLIEFIENKWNIDYTVHCSCCDYINYDNEKILELIEFIKKEIK